MLVGFYRTFDPLSDPSYVGSGYGVLRDSVGGVRAVLVAVALGVAALAALVLLPLAAVRVTRAAARHRRAATTGVVVVGVVWGLARRPRDDDRREPRGRLRPDQHGRRRPRGGPAPGDRGPRRVRAAGRERPVRGDLPAESPRRPAGQGRARRLRRELRSRRPRGPAPRSHGDRSGRPGHDRARRRGVLRPQRLPHLADVRRPQLAGALHAPDRPPDHRPGPLQRRPRHPAADPGLGVRVGGLAHRSRQSGRRERHLAGHRVLRVRRPLRRPGPRLPRTEVRVCAGAGPVHPRHPRAAGAHARASGTADGGGRPRLQPHAMGAAAPDAGPGCARRRVRIPAGVRPGRDRRRRLERPRAGQAGVRGLRRLLAGCADLVRRERPRRQPRPRRPGRPPAGGGHLRRGRQPRRPGLRGGQGSRRPGPDRGWGWQPGLRPSAAAPVWPMDAFRDRFFGAFGAGQAGKGS